jgi:hypothetical protein
VTLNVGTYVGIYTCELCHSGGSIAQDMYTYMGDHRSLRPYSRKASTAYLSSHYSVSCIKCHTVGYDTNASCAA